MENLIAGICIVICVLVIILGLKIFRESRTMEQKDNNEKQDEVNHLQP